jgi:hypothetical protein
MQAGGIEQCTSVVAWAAGLREQWGGDPFVEDPEKLDSLERFCRFAGMHPDALLAFCFLRRQVTGERFASVKRREELLQRLAAWESASGWRGLEARRRRNHVASFLSHNGVLI